MIIMTIIMHGGTKSQHHRVLVMLLPGNIWFSHALALAIGTVQWPTG
jgi:hypothetical protein